MTDSISIEQLKSCTQVSKRISAIAEKHCADSQVCELDAAYKLKERQLVDRLIINQNKRRFKNHVVGSVLRNTIAALVIAVCITPVVLMYVYGG